MNCYCSDCGGVLRNQSVTRCPHCGVHPCHVKTELTAEEQAAALAAGAACAALIVAAIVFVFKALGKLFKLIWKALTWWIPLTFKKPKIMLPIEAGIIVAIYAYSWWYNQPEQQFARAETYLKSDKRQEDGVKLIKTAAEKEYVPAMMSYADILSQGKYGKKINAKEAFALWVKSSNKGDAKAYFYRGACLEQAYGTSRNLTEANECYRKAVNLGFAKAQRGLDRTSTIAKYWTPAYKNDAEAQYHLGICYAEGNGIAKDEKTARFWFQKSADAGFAPAQVLLCSWMISGRGGVQNIALGISYCEKAAKQNYPEAFNYLGEYYFKGEVVNRNYPKAIQNFVRASKSGSASAAFNLGFCYREGRGVEKNIVKAFEYFKLASEKDYPPALFALGLCYEHGSGTEIEYTEALNAYIAAAKKEWHNDVTKTGQKDAITAKNRLSEIGKWWTLATRQKEAQAQCNVGTCYFTGNGVEKDLNTALEWFRKAAAQNNDEGIVRVADCQFYGYGIPKNQGAAVEIYLSAARKGVPYAMFRIGECLEHGVGIEQNLSDAYLWYKKAASANFTTAAQAAARIEEPGEVWNDAVKNNVAEAQCRLGACYYFGDKGLPKDLKKAFFWFKKSADQGFVKANHNLGICYLHGYGTDVNHDLMRKCFMKAADENYPPSISTLGEIYQKGIGVEQNLTTAYKYYEKAAASQDKHSLLQLKRIKNIAKYWDSAHRGNPEAQFELAVCYDRGDGIGKDSNIAEQWFLKSAEQGNANAQYAMAQKLRSRSEKNKENAEAVASWLEKAERSGHVRAGVELGICYYSGTGVKEDYDKSVELWEKAAKANNADAMYWLGKHRFNGRGMFNSGKDVDKAIALWSAAARLGQMDACLSLAKYYYNGVGLLNSGRDRAKASLFYRKAVEGGNVDAMFEWGFVLYESGESAEKKAEGVKWLKNAASMGHEKAKAYVKDKQIR